MTTMTALELLDLLVAERTTAARNRRGTVDDIRWTCEECGPTHNRDENAAVNVDVAGVRSCIHPEDTGGCTCLAARGGTGTMWVQRPRPCQCESGAQRERCPEQRERRHGGIPK